VNESIAATIQQRGKNLKAGFQNLLNDPDFTAHTVVRKLHNIGYRPNKVQNNVLEMSFTLVPRFPSADGRGSAQTECEANDSNGSPNASNS
jgi:hypothetical protein